jgi:hypothetical protein
MAELCAPHEDRILELVALMDEQHPHQPHEYLWFVGVVPAAQGRGLGSALMAPVLERRPGGSPGLPRGHERTQQSALRAARLPRHDAFRRRRRTADVADVARPGLTPAREPGTETDNATDPTAGADLESLLIAPATNETTPTVPASLPSGPVLGCGAIDAACPPRRRTTRRDP